MSKISCRTAIIGGGVIGRQTLRPLEAMARQATAITGRDAAGRLTTPYTYDELVARR